jgi:flagellar motor component MotA
MATLLGTFEGFYLIMLLSKKIKYKTTKEHKTKKPKWVGISVKAR